MPQDKIYSGFTMDGEFYSILIVNNSMIINGVIIPSEYCVFYDDNRIVDLFTGEIYLDDTGYIASELINLVNKYCQ